MRDSKSSQADVFHEKNANLERVLDFHDQQFQADILEHGLDFHDQKFQADVFHEKNVNLELGLDFYVTLGGVQVDWRRR